MNKGWAIQPLLWIEWGALTCGGRADPGAGIDEERIAPQKSASSLLDEEDRHGAGSWIWFAAGRTV